jgi:hypothetical protein
MYQNEDVDEENEIGRNSYAEAEEENELRNSNPDVLEINLAEEEEKNEEPTAVAQLSVENSIKSNSVELSSEMFTSLSINKETIEQPTVAVETPFQNDHSKTTNQELVVHQSRLVRNLAEMHPVFSFSSLYPKNKHWNWSGRLDESHLILTSMLIDKVYQVVQEQFEELNAKYERVLRSVKYSTVTSDSDNHDSDHQLTLTDIWDGLLESIPLLVKELISMVKQLPGLNELQPSDLMCIINNRLIDFYLLKVSPFHINGDSYMELPNNIRYSRRWMIKVIGKEMTDAIYSFSQDFNELRMTKREIALLYPYLLTVHGRTWAFLFSCYLSFHKNLIFYK